MAIPSGYLPARLAIPFCDESRRHASFDGLVGYYAVRAGDAEVQGGANDTTGPFNESRWVNQAVARWGDLMRGKADAAKLIWDSAFRGAIHLPGEWTG